jgi:hypothetical protein
MDYTNHLGPSGAADNLAGIQYFLYAPISWFNVIGQPLDLSDVGATTESDYVNISTTHTFTTGKGFIRLYATTQTGWMKASMVGEEDGRMGKVEGEGFLPGVASPELGFLRKSKNDKFVILGATLDGKFLQAGSSLLGANLFAEETTTSTSGTGRRGTKYKIECYASWIYNYTGTITLHP